jgi:hypothetical protein
MNCSGWKNHYVFGKIPEQMIVEFLKGILSAQRLTHEMIARGIRFDQKAKMVLPKY